MVRKIVAVADGGTTPERMQLLKCLEKFDGVQVKIIEDPENPSMAEITDRLGLIEQKGIQAAPALEQLVDEAKDAEVIVVHVASVDRAVLENADKLKLVVVARGGTENADHIALEERGIPLKNAPWRSANAVADFTVGLMVAENKNIARSFHYLKEGQWVKEYANQSFIRDMRKCTVGLVGFGNIGQRVAKRLKGFESRILVWDDWLPDGTVLPDYVKRVDDLGELVAESDFVSLHLRSSDVTNNLFDERLLRRMKATAYFINTARSSLVDEEALVTVLKEHAIGGAAVDTFDVEPLPADHPFLSLDNITLTPHIAGTSADTMTTSVEIAYEILDEYLQGTLLQSSSPQDDQ